MPDEPTLPNPANVADVDEALRCGLLAAGIRPTADAVLKAIRAIDRDYDLPDRTLARYLKSGIPPAAKGSTRAHVEILKKVIEREAPEWADRLNYLSEKLWARTLETNSYASADMPSEWYGVIPRQAGRPYASIDRVTIEDIDTENLSGSMDRLSPPDETNLRWKFSGIRDGAEAVFLTFWPIGPTNRRSRGAIALARFEYRQHQDNRLDGHYSRQPDLERGLITREYHWHQHVPASALHRVALLDLDNTLRADWSVRPWLKFLSKRRGWSEAGRSLQDVERLIADLERGELDHDGLVRSCESVYAELLKGRTIRDVGDQAAVFINSTNRQAIHRYVKPLLSALRSRWIAPIIVSGAPSELVSRYAKVLGIEEWFGFSLRAEDGTYDGSVEDNPGVTERKEAIVQQVAKQKREIVLAVGDSESDIPLWDASPNRIIVGLTHDELEWMPERAFRLDPTVTQWTDIEAWLDDALPQDDDG